MGIPKAKKSEIIKEFQCSAEDTGSSEVQIALLTENIRTVNDHLSENKKDHSTQRALLKLVGSRRKLLKYLKIKNPNKYQQTIKKLNLRK